MAKKVSDEKLLEMLLVHGGATGAAAALGISRNAVFKRLQEPVFRAQYDAAQGVVLSTAAASTPRIRTAREPSMAATMSMALRRAE